MKIAAKLILIFVFFSGGMVLMNRNPYSPPVKKSNVGDFTMNCPDEYLDIAQDQQTRADLFIKKGDNLIAHVNSAEALKEAYDSYRQAGFMLQQAAELTKLFTLPPDEEKLNGIRRSENYCSERMRLIEQEVKKITG